MSKFFIAVPCMDQVPSRFAQSLAMLRRPGDTQIGFEQGSLVYSSRNNLARAAVKLDADWILWIDSDMTFSSDLLERMVNSCKENDADMLCGLFFKRIPPYSTVLFDRLDFSEEKGVHFTTIESIPDGVFEVGGCGFGGVLMRTDVVMDVLAKFSGRLFDPLPGMGEDISFCWRARQCGYKIFCDSSIEMGHIGYCEVNRGYYEAFRKGEDNAGQSEAGDEDLE